MSGSKEWFDISERFLGKSVGALIPVLGKTACMSQDYRELYVILDHTIKLGKAYNIGKEGIELLEKIVLPLLTDLGRAEFKRDILTSLSFALSQKSKEQIDMTKQDKDIESLADIFKKDTE